MDAASPYRSHPIFKLRVAVLANASVGLFLTTFVVFDGYRSFRSIFSFIFLLFILSIAVSCYDLVRWAINRDQADGAYKSSLKIVSLVEIFLGSLFVYVYAQEMIDLDRYLNRHRHNYSDVITIYGTLPPLIAAILHGVCVLKQLEIKKKRAAFGIPTPFSTRSGPIRIEEGE